MKDDNQTLIEVKPLEPNLHVVNQVLQANQESTSIDKL